jgi:hypothetical protein
MATDLARAAAACTPLNLHRYYLTALSEQKVGSEIL